MGLIQGPIHLPSDGCPGLLINLGDPFLLSNGNTNLQKISGCWIVGASTRYIAGNADGNKSCFIVKFLPGQLSRFFQIPGIELTDTCVSIETIWGKKGKEFENKIAEAKSVDVIIQIIETVFLDLLTLNYCGDERIHAALNTIVWNRGQVKITDLAKSVGLCLRQFERNFLTIVGLTPKRLCRVVRFSIAFQQVSKNQEQNWSDLALYCGYSDQAHFIRECKYFTNYSPGNYMEIRSPFEIAAHGLKNVGYK